MPIIRANIRRESAVITDAASWYKNLKCAPQSRYRESEENALRIGALTKPASIKQQTKQFLRWRKRRGD